MNDRMRKGCCRLLTLLLTLVLVIPAYGQETLDALAAAQGNLQAGAYGKALELLTVPLQIQNGDTGGPLLREEPGRGGADPYAGASDQGHGLFRVLWHAHSITSPELGPRVCPT